MHIQLIWNPFGTVRFDLETGSPQSYSKLMPHPGIHHLFKNKAGVDTQTLQGGLYSSKCSAISRFLLSNSAMWKSDDMPERYDQVAHKQGFCGCRLLDLRHSSHSSVPFHPNSDKMKIMKHGYIVFTWHLHAFSIMHPFIKEWVGRTSGSCLPSLVFHLPMKSV